MAVWEQTEDSVAEALFRSAVRVVALVTLAVILVGPVVVGGWMANAYIVYRTSADELQLPALDKQIPSPAELISASVDQKPQAHH
ncbi:hypothetical protein [Nisaea nitritireducens]|uniref:hypothetical protein n=1 Tax=Nisaea nitritireducens TaxID=568392 RepID=UPI001868BDB2|nr:hypothetical protein [Nisaea nitritireducens]